MTLEQALAKLKKDVKSVMADEMKEEAIQYHKQAVKQDVYSAYEPSIYKRRWDLAEDGNISVRVSGYHLVLKNTTPPNGDYGGSIGKDLSQVIETGIGYDYDFNMARPFIQGTEDRLSGGTADAIMAEGLGARGWGC